jgi:hypothetical protein
MNLSEIKKIIKELAENKSVLLAKPQIIGEANYGRVKDKIENQMVPFVMLSGFRGNLSKKNNLKRQKGLESIVSSTGYPWTKMPGSGYVEDPEIEGEAPREVRENSILIWDEKRPDKEESDLSIFELAKFLANEYNQDSFIHGRPFQSDDGESEMIIRLYTKDGDPIKESWAGPWSSLTQVNDDDLFWSAIGSKQAKLTEMLEQYKSMKVGSKLEAMEKQYKIDAAKSALKRTKE